jgi:hypothetical protein
MCEFTTAAYIAVALAMAGTTTQQIGQVLTVGAGERFSSIAGYLRAMQEMYSAAAA